MKENPTPAEPNREKIPDQEPGKIFIIWLWWVLILSF
jgi:hypothetical protein